jgi:hypothetical protein
MGDFLFMSIFITMNLQEHIKKVLKEELNESKFFNRRIDFDEVKKLLSVYAEEIFFSYPYNYNQFKHNLILKAVESFMDNDYELGFGNVRPEQEEIDFIEQVSDMFEGIIKHLYKTNKETDVFRYFK